MSSGYRDIDDFLVPVIFTFVVAVLLGLVSYGMILGAEAGGAADFNFDKSFYAGLSGAKPEKKADLDSDGFVASKAVLHFVGKNDPKNSLDALQLDMRAIEPKGKDESFVVDDMGSDTKVALLSDMGLEDNVANEKILMSFLDACENSPRIFDLFRSNKEVSKMVFAVKGKIPAKDFLSKKYDYFFGQSLGNYVRNLLILWVLVSIIPVLIGFANERIRLKDIDWSYNPFWIMALLTLPGMLFLFGLKAIYWLFFSSEPISFARGKKEKHKQNRLTKEEKKKERERPTTQADLFS